MYSPLLSNKRTITPAGFRFVLPTPLGEHSLTDFAIKSKSALKETSKSLYSNIEAIISVILC